MPTLPGTGVIILYSPAVSNLQHRAISHSLFSLKLDEQLSLLAGNIFSSI